MESFRSLVGMKAKQPTATDEDIFTEEIMLLVKPHIGDVLAEIERDRKNSIPVLYNTETELIREVNQRLLKKFYGLAKTDSGLNKFMIPIMMYLRSARMKRGVR